MRARAELFWRLLPDVRTGERTRFLFFAGLFTLISLAQTVGLAGSEALLLGTLGARALPRTFVFASLVTVAGSFGYAALVGRLRNDDLFMAMLIGAAALLGAGAALAGAGTAWRPARARLPLLSDAGGVPEPLLDLQRRLLRHAREQAAGAALHDRLELRRRARRRARGRGLERAVADRAGGGLGAAARRVGAAAVASRAGRCAAGARSSWTRRTRRRSRTCAAPCATSAARRSARWMFVASLGMVLTLFLAQYLYSDIFARSFRDAAGARDLLRCLSGGDQRGRDRDRGGADATLDPAPRRARRRTCVHPVLMLGELRGSRAARRVSERRSRRASTASCSTTRSRTPVRTLLYNAMPLQLRGRMRAFLEGIVVYAGMSIAGAGAARVRARRIRAGCACAGGVAALALPRREPRRAARTTWARSSPQLRAGRLDLADVHGEIGGWEATRARRAVGAAAARRGLAAVALAAPAGARAGGAWRRRAARARGLAPEPGRAALVPERAGRRRRRTSRSGRSRSRSTTPTPGCVWSRCGR